MIPPLSAPITTPKRGIGNQTLEKLATYAGTRNISLFEAAFESAMEQQLPARQHEELLTFCKFINRMQERAGKEECTPVLADLMSAIDYEAWLFDSHEPKQAEKQMVKRDGFCRLDQPQICCRRENPAGHDADDCTDEPARIT